MPTRAQHTTAPARVEHRGLMTPLAAARAMATAPTIQSRAVSWEAAGSESQPLALAAMPALRAVANRVQVAYRLMAHKSPRRSNKAQRMLHRQRSTAADTVGSSVVQVTSHRALHTQLTMKSALSVEPHWVLVTSVYAKVP